MSGKTGNYSNIIIYDENKRYYYFHSQKNKPLTDDEIRGISISQLDQTRRGIQHTYGDIAVPYKKYCLKAPLLPTDDAFKVIGLSNNNFYVKGGSTIENPAVLYIKGFYVFLTGDLYYNTQQYPSDLIDLGDDSITSDKTKTLSLIPSLTTPVANRVDIIYVDIHFAEATAVTGTDPEIYYDSSLRDPRFGTETANRLRAVFDVKVIEGYTGSIDKNIFYSSSFLDPSVVSLQPPTSNHYKVPIAVIYRKAGNSNLSTDQIVDLLTLYDKRVMSLEELTYRTKHGGYSAKDLIDLGTTGLSKELVDAGVSGFTPQYPYANLYEGAYASGVGEGLGTEAFNTNSVTPRVLDNSGKFLMGALQVGEETGSFEYPNTPATGPEQLNKGEIVANQESLNSLYIGYDSGTTGVREYKDALSINTQGLTGPSSSYFVKEDVDGVAALAIQNKGTITGIYSSYISSYDPVTETLNNFSVIDFKGRLGFNTFQPAWDNIPSDWNTDRYSTGVNVVVDINDSQRIRKHFFVDKDAYIGEGLYGKTWSIPSILSDLNKAYLGFTGIPQSFSFNDLGLTGSQAVVVIKPGVATVGVSGLSDYKGYTGVAGFYEAYNSNGERLFTIGDLGEDFDRVVKTLYGTSVDSLWFINKSFTDLLEWGRGIETSDIISYSINFNSNPVPLTVAGYSVTYDGYTGLQSFVASLYTGISTYDSSYCPGDTGTYVYSLNNPYDSSDPSNGSIIIKDPNNAIESIDYILLEDHTTLLPDITIDDDLIVKTHFYGSGSYGGDLLDIKFAKLDLGEAANAWLFNGDVFFNGNGLLNRVTFSPNAIFRDDVFVYGSLFANDMYFVSANLGDLTVSRKLLVSSPAYFEEQVVIGIPAPTAAGRLASELVIDTNLKALINGDINAHNFIVSDGLTTTPKLVLGNTFPNDTTPEEIIYATIGGYLSSTEYPFGIHLIDKSSDVAVTSNEGFRSLVMDFGDGFGNYGKIDVRIRGNLSVVNDLAANNTTISNTLTVSGKTTINNTLEVKELKFIGSGAPSELTGITQPQNALIFKGNEKVVNSKTSGILRLKEFSVDNKYVFFNIMGYAAGSEHLITYCGIVVGSNASWTHDTMSYPYSLFISEHSDTLNADSYNSRANADPLFRGRFNRYVVATLGTLKINWVGEYNTSPGTIDIENAVQSYIFSTPYFKDKEGNSDIDWSSTNLTNYMINVEACTIDDKVSSPYPQLYTINRPLWVYIPLSSWNFFSFDKTEARGESFPRTLVLYTNYINTAPLSYMSIAEMTKLNSSTGASTEVWKIAIYPRFKTVTRLAQGSDYIYNGEWDVDLVIFPEATGTSSSIMGNVYITKV